MKKLKEEKNQEDEDFGVYQNFAKAFEKSPEVNDGDSGEERVDRAEEGAGS